MKASGGWAVDTVFPLAPWDKPSQRTPEFRNKRKPCENILSPDVAAKYFLASCKGSCSYRRNLLMSNIDSLFWAFLPFQRIVALKQLFLRPVSQKALHIQPSCVQDQVTVCPIHSHFEWAGKTDSRAYMAMLLKAVKVQQSWALNGHEAEQEQADGMWTSEEPETRFFHKCEKKSAKEAAGNARVWGPSPLRV